jgi:hypothetical protein
MFVMLYYSCADIDDYIYAFWVAKCEKEDILLSSSTNKHYDNRRITIIDRSILNEQDEHGDKRGGRERREDD